MKLTEETFETVYNVNIDSEGFYIIDMKGEDCEINVCCTEKQFIEETFDSLCKITNFKVFYDFCCEHECSLV